MVLYYTSDGALSVGLTFSFTNDANDCGILLVQWSALQRLYIWAVIR